MSAASSAHATLPGTDLTWYGIKAWLIEASGVGLTNDELHLPLGLAAYLACALVLRRYRLGPVWALVPVVLLQGLNEGLDARDWWHWTGNVPWSEMLTDSLATLAAPAVIATLWMLRRQRKT
jgi:hypothetical protein